MSKNFSRNEAKCQCGECKFDTMDYALVEALEELREYFKNKKVIITSWCRCYEHNKKVGGSENSKHILGQAVDFKVQDVHANNVADYLENKYSNSCGIGRYKGRTHFDIRKNKARWDLR